MSDHVGGERVFCEEYNWNPESMLSGSSGGSKGSGKGEGDKKKKEGGHHSAKHWEKLETQKKEEAANTAAM